MAQYALPDHLLNKLKCSLCFEHLSHPPILLYADTGSVCGRCPALEAEKNLQPLREKNYEDVASMLSFPCRYKPNGCTENLPMQQVPTHEQSCSFKPYFCPILPLGSCAWQGSPNELHGHFAMNHQEMLMESNEFELDVVNNYRDHYILPALGELFILRIEFQNSDTMFRGCLHLVGKPDLHKNYEYEMVFTTNDEDFSWTHSKQIVESDLNIMERRNECIVELATLKDILQEPSFITCKVKVRQATIISIDDLPEDDYLNFDVSCDIEPDVETEKPDFVKPKKINRLLEDLECPVCQEFMVPPIFQCVTGHSICGICKPQLKECPTCRNAIGDTRNFTLEKITENLEYNCKNTDDGCNFVSNSLSIRQHENECPYKPNHCPLQETLNCAWLGNWNKLLSHCQKDHADSIQKNAFFQTIYNPACVRFEIFQIKQELGLNFRIRYSYTDNQVACTVQCIIPPQGNFKLMYEIIVVDSNNTGLVLLSRKNCGTLSDNKDDLKHCTIWNLNMVKPFISQTDQTLKFKCVIYKV